MKFLNLDIVVRDYRNNVKSLLAAIELEAEKKKIALEAKFLKQSLVIEYKRIYGDADYQTTATFVIGDVKYKNVKHRLELFLEMLVKFTPLIEGDLIRPPENMAERSVLSDFLAQKGLPLTKVGFSYFVNGFILESTRHYTDYEEMINDFLTL